MRKSGSGMLGASMVEMPVLKRRRFRREVEFGGDGAVGEGVRCMLSMNKARSTRAA